MPASAVLLVLAAAFLHAGWNLHVAGRDDTAAATATAFLVGTVLLLPIAVATWDVDAAAIPFMAVSVVLELVYLALLAAAYGRSELSVVYPVARGSAPVLVLLAVVIVGGGGASGLQAVGVVVVGAGVALCAGSAPAPAAPTCSPAWPSAS